MGIYRAKGVETHYYRRSHEHGITELPWTRTYGLGVMKDHVGARKDMQHRDVPVLQYRQAHRGSNDFWTPYSDEQREYYQAIV